MEIINDVFSNYWIFLAIGGFLLLFIVPWLLVWRYKANRRWLKENGRPTPAKILKIWDSGLRIGVNSDGNMVGVGLLLEVQPEGGQPYQVKVRDQLHTMDLSRIAPSMMIEVRVHPNKPGKVVISNWNVMPSAQMR